MLVKSSTWSIVLASKHLPGLQAILGETRVRLQVLPKDVCLDHQTIGAFSNALKTVWASNKSDQRSWDILQSGIWLGSTLPSSYICADKLLSADSGCWNVCSMPGP